MKKKRILLFLLFLGLFVFPNKIYGALSYDFNLNADSSNFNTSNKNTNVTIKLKSNEASDAINVCFFNLSSDSGIVINSGTAANGWSLTNSDNNSGYLLTSNTGALSSSGEISLYSFSVTVNNTGNIYVKDIKCSNSTDETSKSNITHKMTFAPASDTPSTPSNPKVDNPQTGGKSVLTILIASLVLLAIAYYYSKKNSVGGKNEN